MSLSDESVPGKQTHDIEVCTALFQRTARPAQYRVGITEGSGLWALGRILVLIFRKMGSYQSVLSNVIYDYYRIVHLKPL